MPTRYYLSLPDPQLARGSDPAFAFSAHGADEFAAQLQQALRSSDLFERWRSAQEDPDGIDEALGATDPQASVQGSQSNTRIDLVATTALPGNVFKQRLRLLAGSGWELRDVTAA
jgi:hypothetical protein